VIGALFTLHESNKAHLGWSTPLGVFLSLASRREMERHESPQKCERGGGFISSALKQIWQRYHREGDVQQHKRKIGDYGRDLECDLLSG
jgi:hypothetical protein